MSRTMALLGALAAGAAVEGHEHGGVGVYAHGSLPIFTHWGSQTCNDKVSVLVYEGIAATGVDHKGSWSGSGANELCLTMKPNMGSIHKNTGNIGDDDKTARIFGIEYASHNTNAKSGNTQKNKQAACAVCRAKQPGEIYVNWGSYICPEVHNTVYNGWVMANQYHPTGGKTNFVCVDDKMQETSAKDKDNNDDGWTGHWFTTEAQEGSMNEEWYPHDWEVFCSVCQVPAALAQGEIFTRWGHTGCPDHTQQIYSGLVSGNHESHRGGGANYICLTKDSRIKPNAVKTGNEDGALLYGMDYRHTRDDYHGYNMEENGLHPQCLQAACAVCQMKEAGKVFTAWGTMTCGDQVNEWYSDQKKPYKNPSETGRATDKSPDVTKRSTEVYTLYYGMMHASYHNHWSSGQYSCFDDQIAFHSGTEVDCRSGHELYMVNLMGEGNSAGMTSQTNTQTNIGMQRYNWENWRQKELSCAICGVPRQPDHMGDIYTLWGKTSCPDTATQLYQGFMAGDNNHRGNGYNYICMTQYPSYNRHSDGQTWHRQEAGSRVWGIEYDGDGSWEMNGKRYHDVACSVCQVKEPANTFVHWGGWKCPAVSKKHSGLTDRTKGGDEVVEYQGWVAAAKWNYRSTEFVCVDAARDTHYGQRTNANDAGRIYPTFISNNAKHSLDENIYKHRKDWLYCSVCKSQDCPAGHFAAKFADECKACTACGAGEYEDPDTRCTTHSDRKCLKCSTGESGYFMSTPCSDAHGAGEWSKCSPECGDGFYEFVGCNAHHDRQCEPIQDCAPGFFEVLPPTSSSDRQCEKGRVACDRTKEYEIAPATATSGAVCFDFTVGCAKGEYMTEPTPAGKTCHAYTVCASNEYESKAPTDSSDRECKPVSGLCDKETEFEFSAPTRTRDRDCEPLQICGQGQYEAAAPVVHSTGLYNIKDRSCKVLEECAADEYEVITEAGRSCANICHTCEPGTYAKVSCQVATKTLAKRQTECATCTTCGKYETMIEGCTHDHDRVCACTYGSGPTGNCYSSPQGSVRSNSAKVLSSVGDIAMTGESVEIIVDAGRTNVLPAFNLKDELQKTQAQAEEAGAEMDCSIANCE